MEFFLIGILRVCVCARGCASVCVRLSVFLCVCMNMCTCVCVRLKVDLHGVVMIRSFHADEA